MAYFAFALSNGAYSGALFGLGRPHNVRDTVLVCVKSFLGALLTLTFVVFVLKQQTALSRAETLIAGGGCSSLLRAGFVGGSLCSSAIAGQAGVLRVALIRDNEGKRRSGPRHRVWVRG